MKLTPSQVKNLMRRGLRLLVDPKPEMEEKQRCIEFFDHACAYCGSSVEKGRGDLDHLIAAALGGRNHISNRVFSCKPCNAQEKRDKHWEDFLREKHGSGQSFETMRNKILSWVIAAGAVPLLPKTVLHAIEGEAARATAVYDEACKKVRDVLRHTPADNFPAASRHPGSARA